MKFRKPAGPAFKSGETWVGSSNLKVTILSVRKYPGATDDHCSSYGVTYSWIENGVRKIHEKDCWNFQVRYTHLSDRPVNKEVPRG